MDWANRCAELSHAKRLHVGAVIVKDDTVISYGYNGMPAGWDNDCEDVEWCSGGGWLSPEEIEITGATFGDRPLRAASLAAYLACCASRNAAGPADNAPTLPAIKPGTLSWII